MEFLSAIEKNNLKQALIKVTHLETSTKRINFFKFCELEDYTKDLPLEESINDFVISLIAQLITKNKVVNGHNQKVLIIFLTYLLVENNLDTSDKKLIEYIIIKHNWLMLLEDENLTSLHELIKYLNIFTISHKLSAEKSQQIIDIFYNISFSLKNGHSLNELLEESKKKLKIIDNRIDKLVTTFCQESQSIKGYEIPIVLLVMDKAEAKELDSEQAFCDYPHNLNKFKNLKNNLINNSMTNWVDHYQELPEQWQPFNQATSQKNIKQLIEESFEEFIEEHYKQKIVPKFIDISMLNQEGKIDNIKLLKYLRFKGCIVIMDTISMQHPKIQRLFRETALDAFSNTLVVMIAPSALFLELDIVRKIENVIKQRIDIDFYRRLELGDSKCRRVWDNQGFRNWLVNQVHYLMPSAEKEKNTEKPWNNFSKVKGKYS